MQTEQLYRKVFETCVQFAVYQEKNIQENLKLLLPMIEEFTKEFLAENSYGFVEEDYQLLGQLLLNILQDIVEGLEYRDEILLEDTIEYGLKEFLELLIPDEDTLQRLKEECADEQGNI